jgi:hypothetical protein
MKSLGIRVLVAIWLAFMVATVGPVIVPGLATLTAPLTCPGGTINVQIDVYHPRPGETDTTFTPLCTSASGETTEVPTLLSVALIWAGALLPSLLLTLLIPYKFVAFADEGSGRTAAAQKDNAVRVPGHDRETLARLNELKQAHDAGLITQQEYDEKRKEIVKGM